MSTPLTRTEREVLMGNYRAARAGYNDAMDRYAHALDAPAEIGIDETSSAFVDSTGYHEAKRKYAEMTALDREYFLRLPRILMAPCPFCAAPLYRTFDPFGLDGLWWRSDAQPEEPEPCMHFCVLLGAVDLAGHRPHPIFDVHPGPGAPFVMPRLLAHPGMTAVVAEIPMVEGAVAYPVAYFAPRRPPVQTLTASWARTNFVYTTQLGESAWRAAEEPTADPGDRTWDFELAPWLASGQLRWCEPGSDRTRLSGGAPESCPFLQCPGTRAPQLIVAATLADAP
jgi:hypothetical protein